MKEQLVSLEVAKLAKEKGFQEEVNEYYLENGQRYSYFYDDWHGEVDIEDLMNNWNKKGWKVTTNGEACFGCDRDKRYMEAYSAPTQALLQRWLRDVHKIGVLVEIDGSGALWGYSVFPITPEASAYTGQPFINEDILDSYEAALEEGLQEALKLVSNDQ